MPFGDDWSYARTVEHLLKTGQFRIHEWNCANMIFQTYWGAFCSLVFGYSFSVLRLSTLFLAFGGLLAFYQLARLHGLKSYTAGLLAFVMLSSPLCLLYTFSFHTDVPFLSLMIIALLFYTRAVQKKSYGDMLFGAVAASAAILTRQIGITVPAGLFFLWLFHRDFRREKGLVLIGLGLPVAAGIYQTWFSIEATHWCAEATRISQAHLFGNPSRFMGELVWRPTAILQYLSLFSLPMVLVATLAVVAGTDTRTGQITRGIYEKGKASITRSSALTCAVAIYVFIGIVLGDVCDFSYHRDMLMPYLPETALQVIKRLGWIGRVILTIITSIGAILYLRTILERYLDRREWASTSQGQRLLDFVALFLFMLMLIFHLFTDRYLIPLMPYALIIIARRFEPKMFHLKGVTIAACIVMFVASALWVRTALDYAQAMWKGAEYVEQTAKVSPNRIDGGWVWLAYHEFDTYLSDARRRGVFKWTDFKSWQHETRAQCEFTVTKYLPKESEKSKWQIIGQIPYENFFLREKKVFLLRKRTRRPSE